mgnify:CR=1 FL=1
MYVDTLTSLFIFMFKWQEYNAKKAQLYISHLKWLMFHTPENSEAIEIIERKISIYNKLALI